jgi:hypothetical protein
MNEIAASAEKLKRPKVAASTARALDRAAERP